MEYPIKEVFSLDTGTHVVMGLALGGLATLDPVVVEHSHTATSVLIAVIAGSQIPDIDTVLKLKNNATYIRNHRGITHSIPAVLLWPLVIVGILYPILSRNKFIAFMALDFFSRFSACFC